MPEKSNEITAIPELLRLVDIKGTIITIDAMGTQKAIAAQIVDGEADFVLALKGNQETLHQAVIDHIDEQSENDFADVQAVDTSPKKKVMAAKRFAATFKCRCRRICVDLNCGKV